jgi:lysophospholipase L1-like esterase
MMSKINMLALGDSIIWGQGNNEDEKFVSLVQEALRKQGYVPKLYSYAHSGAIVAPAARDVEDPYWEEVPESAPSVQAQLHRALNDLPPTEVDMVLVNGGINDVSALGIVVANPFDPDGLERLRDRTTRTYTQYVFPLVDHLVASCTNATIVVTTYYPLISKQTDPRRLVGLMKHLPRLPGLRNFLDETIEHLTDDALAIAIELEQARMVEQCTLFDALSRRLVDTMVATFQQRNPRIVHAPVQFDPEHAFAARDTWLWSGGDDPLHDERVRRYTVQLKRDPFAWPVYTPIASLGHPNRLGSQAYAQAIVKTLAGMPLRNR